jgi:electron transfer flavoprotein beta subunit
MKIAVILRLEPVLTDELELTDDERDIDREWIGLDLNQFDDQALEQAVLLKESMGASVTALAVEDEGVERMLKTALARGADEVFQIPMDEDEVESFSSRAMAPIYAAALRDIQPDLVLVGVLSTADLYGELAPYLAAHLDWPQASAISGVTLDAGKVTVRQEYAGGQAALIEMPTPSVVGLQTAEQPPRFVAGSKLRDLLKTQIPDLEIDAEPGNDLAESTTLELPDLSGGANMIEGDVDAIAAQIHEILTEKGFV